MIMYKYFDIYHVQFYKGKAMKKVNILRFFAALGVPIAAYIDKLTGPKERKTHFRAKVIYRLFLK